MQVRLLFILTVTSVLHTHAQVLSPRRLRFKVLSPGVLAVTWKEPKGAFDSYRLVYSTDSGGFEQEMSVNKNEPKAVIQGLDPSKDYMVKIMTVRGTEESKPLMGTYTGSEVSEVSVRQDPRDPEHDSHISEGVTAVFTSVSVYGFG